MNKLGVAMVFLACIVLSACAEEKQQQVFIPEAQLDALNKAKNLQDDLLKQQQQRQKEFQEQGL